MAKSSCCYQEIAINAPDKYEEVREFIRKSFRLQTVHMAMNVFFNVKDAYKAISEKVIRRLMKEEQLVVKNLKKKKYSSNIGKISPDVENKVNRDFHAEMPNQKWLTDITEFHIPAGKVYLSPIIDCFDGLPVS